LKALNFPPCNNPPQGAVIRGLTPSMLPRSVSSNRSALAPVNLPLQSSRQFLVQLEECPFSGFAPWTARRKAKNSNIEKRFLLIRRSSRATCWRNRLGCGEHHSQAAGMADQSGDPLVQNRRRAEVAR